jgi:hypothetical protein
MKNLSFRRNLNPGGYNIKLDDILARQGNIQNVYGSITGVKK